MKKKLVKYGKILLALTLIGALALPSYATVGASDGSAFVTKAEFDAALSDFNSRLTTFEAGINSKIDSQVSSYLDRNGIWSGKEQTFSTEIKISNAGKTQYAVWPRFPWLFKCEDDPVTKGENQRKYLWCDKDNAHTMNYNSVEASNRFYSKQYRAIDWSMDGNMINSYELQYQGAVLSVQDVTYCEWPVIEAVNKSGLLYLTYDIDDIYSPGCRTNRLQFSFPFHQGGEGTDASWWHIMFWYWSVARQIGVHNAGEDFQAHISEICLEQNSSLLGSQAGAFVKSMSDKFLTSWTSWPASLEPYEWALSWLMKNQVGTKAAFMFVKKGDKVVIRYKPTLMLQGEAAKPAYRTRFNMGAVDAVIFTNAVIY